MKNKKILLTMLTVFCIIMQITSVSGQGLGDNLAYQGLTGQNSLNSVKARAMGNAYIAISGDLNSIYYNSAGLADIDNIQFSVSYNNNAIKTFERQQVYPRKSAWGVMELIWAGYYEPHLEHDGIRSDGFQYDPEDFVKPDSAVEYYDENYADWIEEHESGGLNNFSFAVPFNAFDKKVVASAAYAVTQVYDFDRNNLVLGVDKELGPKRKLVNNDWIKYNRSREGELNTVVTGLAAQISDNFNFGLNFEYMSGETDDVMQNDKFGHYLLESIPDSVVMASNTYYFWHDSTMDKVSGTSNFNSSKVGIGALYKNDKVAVGLRIDLPYTLKRTYDYHQYEISKSLRDSTASPVTNKDERMTGTDKFSAPFTFALGFSIKPNNYLLFAIDYRLNPYSKGTYNLSSNDSTAARWAWPDLNSLNVGLEIIPFNWMSVLAGYRYQSDPLRPQDHFKAEKIGSKSEIFSCGLSIRIPHGVLDFAYEWRNKRYIDYYSVHNDYTTWQNKTLLAGLTVIL